MATPLDGAINAKAGTGGVAKGLVVKLSAAGTIVIVTSTTDKSVGICEVTAAAGAATRYAPPGTRTTVTSGAAVAVGDPLAGDTVAKATQATASDRV
ncbi:MAG TPA: hypothetical protein VMZ50_01715, partial [Phycisphaerae bacterium]|nr:hypothetical protein [Phycisphaerae bacterium]